MVISTLRRLAGLSAAAGRQGHEGAAVEAIAGAFDPQFYRAHHPDPESDDAALALHYLTTGWREGRDPSAAFSTGWYLASNPDVAESGVNPLLHYIRHGRAEGRTPLPPAAVPVRPVWPAEVAAAFDAAFYRGRNPELAGDDAALLDHYMTTGWREGRDPAPGFSTRHYLSVNADVADAGVNPLLHYVTAGQAEGRSPLPPPPAPAAAARRKAREQLERDLAAAAPHFDANFYRSRNPDVPGDDRALLEHFMTHGWQEERDPAPGFSTRWYLQTYKDIAKGGLNPFLHYILAGKNEGRKPLPPPPRPPESDLAAVAPLFDAAFYRATYPDVTGTDDELLVHFMLFGWREGRDPAPGFSTKYYTETYEDVAKGRLNPLLHYAVAGKAEGRHPVPPPPPPPEPPKPAVSDADLNAVAPQFDATFYRTTNPDVTGTDAQLLLHFMTEGWREGRDPRPDFSTRYYLDTYSDIAFAGLNPFLHYVLFGKREGRRAMAAGPVAMMKSPDATTVPAHLKAVTLRAPADLVPPAPPARVNPAAMDIHWVVPDFSRGSGGHMTIFRMVRFLELFGHRCTIWIEAPTHHKTAAAAHDDIVKYFQCVAARVAFIEDGFFAATGDAVIATGWSTAYPVSRATGFAARYYFVQDHEPEFYPTGTDARLARLSYGLDLACICASPWLDGIMSGRYGRWARHFHLAYDPEHYRIIDEEAHARRFPARRKAAATKDEPVRIAVYARDHTARRCVALALIALETLGAKGAPIEVHFFGQRDLPFFQTNFTAFNHGVLDAPDLAALYNRCDIGICFSATNYSLVPQEMMACGLPVVELDGESTRAIFPEGVVTFAGPSPEDIAAKLEALVADPKARRAQMLKALDWVRGFSWEGAARKVEGAITAYLGERALAAPPVARPSEVLLDVVIPTYNGMNELKPVIEALRGQRGREAIRVHCIDSSSGDGTTEWLRAQPDINLTVIDKREFQHGRTRNWGAAMGTAPLIAFLTQDAMPATDTWAQDIVMMFDHHPEAAGLFGRHLPYPNHPEFVREEITTHFQNMLKHPLALSKNTDPERWERGDIGWRQLLHFYSDNNSAMRRRVWQDIPYPEVPYGEDQVWARDIIEAGHVKLYAPTATVYHSHDYDPDETYARSKIEGEFFFTHFGYRLGDGTAEQLDRRIEREQAIFRRRALVRGMPADEIEMRVANIAAKHRGWRDGLAAGEAAAQKGKAT